MQRISIGKKSNLYSCTLQINWRSMLSLSVKGPLKEMPKILAKIQFAV